MLRLILKEGEQFLQTDFTQPNNGNAKIAYKDKNNKPITKCFVKYIISLEDEWIMLCLINRIEGIVPV